MTKPNVLVFFTDQQRWDCSGLHGNPLDLMPNFDRLARQGTHLAKAFTCQPVCGPARSCFQTGKYATTTGHVTNTEAVIGDEKTIAHHFTDAGYTTGYIGKWHLAKGRDGAVPVEERGGYDYWLASNLLEFTSNAYDVCLYNNDNEEVKLPGYRVDTIADATIRYIDEHQDEPFFLFTSYIEPHHQNHIDDYPPPDGYRERYANKWVPPDLQALGGTTQQHLGGYYGMVKRLDEALGRVVDALKSLKLLDNTIILFTTDHGCHFKTRNSEYKRSCHESSTRLPTMIHGPGFMAGGEINELVSLIDFPPTLLDSAGIDVPDYMQGRSILPLAQKTDVDWPDSVFTQISEAQVGRSIRTQRWKYCVDASDFDDAWKTNSSSIYKEQYLYDLQADPYELRNLINEESHDKIKELLREKLIARMVDAGEEAPEIIPAETKPSGQRVVTHDELDLEDTINHPFRDR
ncbi:MAG: sulfatase-like hydrolase/transferase [Lentisphaeria bacterium]|nr:sulfatase-like hydrolase/transferase [Lentisphaeria bacterium]